MDENKHIIVQIVVPFFSWQSKGLLFHGVNEDRSTTKKVLETSSCFAASDSILFNHLSKPRAKNATYIFAISQNDIINVIWPKHNLS